ncbi:adenylate/guanylate cyclase domain-containing protein [Ruegeria arenilitoris]|uniref:adenylate/guanylate cyclase domain-containing protein n=1 Tax=Ruegeria arenilitoris TaxID=1173585 RepID=UPI00147E415F|nr:adenylate/guanylate cyclase domain-containing response regulator [Ruegeria arenilitoris]
MQDPPLILIVDDQQDNRNLLSMRLNANGYITAEAIDGEDALEKATDLLPDLILLDVMMPKMDGFEVCRRLRMDPLLPFIPVVLVTARSDTQDMVQGLEAGANDYLTKPVDGTALIARVRSMLRIKALHDEVQGWNKELEDRVNQQVNQIERFNRLRRFLPRQVAEEVISGGDDSDLLKNRRADIVVLFADLRGFSTFTEASEPGVVIEALNVFHNCAGPLIEQHQGTLERFLGDGIVVLFNAPLPTIDPTAHAVAFARELHAKVAKALTPFQKGGLGLSLGIGIAKGVTTIGCIGFEGRFDYAAIGHVPNLAARLCEHAEPAQTLVDASIVEALEETREAEFLRNQKFKGLSGATPVFSI